MGKISETVVLTGGPSSGKSSVITELRRRGYKTISETASEVISEFENSGRKDNLAAMYDEISHRQLEKEKDLSGKVFLDRSTVDVLSYIRDFYGSRNVFDEDYLNPRRHDYVFLLERLPFKMSENRLESDEAVAKKRHLMVLSEYARQGYSLESIPTFRPKSDEPTPEEITVSVRIRTNYILNILGWPMGRIG